jgi:hypothetical protein
MNPAINEQAEIDRDGYRDNAEKRKHAKFVQPPAHSNNGLAAGFSLAAS